MDRITVLIALAVLSAAVLTPATASAVSLRAFQQAADDPPRQMALFKSDFETSVTATLAALRSTHFTDGKEKIADRIRRDRERADRIEQMAPRLTSEQIKNLVNMIARYAAAQPETDLKAVIESFLLTEAKTPFDREFQGYEQSHDKYETDYRLFMESMNSWKRAADEAQAELDREKADLERRRRELNQSNSR
ncbi:MAG: hypothetical protein ACREUT_14790 [Steroidobacteraceae bacterium]